jgi:hypothetical protein
MAGEDHDGVRPGWNLEASAARDVERAVAVEPGDAVAARQGKGRNEPDSGFCGTKICGLNLILDTRRCALLLQGATLIDKDDGISGYFQVALHPDSQHLTGVYTPLGVRVFNVMPLGINVTPTTGPS